MSKNFGIFNKENSYVTSYNLQQIVQSNSLQIKVESKGDCFEQCGISEEDVKEGKSRDRDQGHSLKKLSLKTTVVPHIFSSWKNVGGFSEKHWRADDTFKINGE